MRRGFTLIEMLVASGIFLFGFMAVYSMFLIGVRYRTQADATTRGATVASSIIAEIRLRATNESAEVAGSTAWAIPSNYIGDGFPTTTLPGEQPTTPWSPTATFFAHPDQPGMYYRVTNATDPADGDGDSDTILLTLVVGQLESGDAELPFSEIAQRFRFPSPTDHEAMVDALVARDTLQRYDAVIHRRMDYRRP